MIIVNQAWLAHSFYCRARAPPGTELDFSVLLWQRPENQLGVPGAVRGLQSDGATPCEVKWPGQGVLTTGTVLCDYFIHLDISDEVASFTPAGITVTEKPVSCPVHPHPVFRPLRSTSWLLGLAVRKGSHARRPGIRQAAQGHTSGTCDCPG